MRAARESEWKRLDELSRTRHLDGVTSDELIDRYRAASADLADIKTSVGRSPDGDYISTVLARARYRLTAHRENVLVKIPSFFVIDLPAALYRVRWTFLGVTVFFLIVAVLTGYWLSSDPARVAALGNAAQLESYAKDDFTAYYTKDPSGIFAGMVWTNNAWIAAQAVLFGATGIWPLYILMQNASGIGTTSAVMFAYDRGDVFFLSILPHGLLELSCVFVAVAAGLHIFWAWVAPGRRTRGEALASEGRALTTVALGLIVWLFISGLVEGFVTGSALLPSWAKITIGAVAWGAFLVYMLWLGRIAARGGATGDLTEHEVGTPRLVAG